MKSRPETVPRPVVSDSAAPFAQPAAAAFSPRRGWPLLLVLALTVGLWVPRLSGPIDLRYDAGVYFSLGVSLAEGRGYRILSEPGEPEGVQYPPALPALVALEAKAAGTTDPVELGRWLRRTYFVLSLALSAAVLSLARTLLPHPWSVLAAGFALLQLNSYLLSDLLFTELPFSLVTVLLLRLLAKPAVPGAGRETAGFLLTAAGFLLRTAGLALFAAWIGDAVMQRRWKLAALRLLLCALPFGVWQAHVSRVRASEAYQHPAYAYQRAPYQFYNVTYAENVALVDPFRPELGRADASALARRFLENLRAMPSALGEAVSTTFGFWRWGLNASQDLVTASRPIPEWAARVPLLLLAAAICLGLVVIARRGSWAFALCTAASVALVCATPWPGQFARYLAPLTALLSIAAVSGGLWLWSLARASGGPSRRAAAWSLAGLIAFTVSAQLFTLVQVFVRRQSDPRMASLGRPEEHHVFYHDATWARWEKAAAWIGEHARQGTIVATSAPHLLNLWTGHPAIFPPMEADAAKARRLLEAVPVGYVIIDELSFLDISRRYASPAVAAEQGAWRLVFSAGATRVYAREGGSR